MTKESREVSNLTTLLTNVEAIVDKYFDMFFNPQPMDITVVQYDSSGNEKEYTVPNMAKYKLLFTRVEADPRNEQNEIEAKAGALVLDVNAMTPYVKISEDSSPTGGSVGWAQVLTTREMLAHNVEPNAHELYLARLNGNINEYFLVKTPVINDPDVSEENRKYCATNVDVVGYKSDLKTRDNTNIVSAVNDLQKQIDVIGQSTDVYDVVSDYNTLLSYSTVDVPPNDIIKVLTDNTHDDAPTYYRCLKIIEVPTHESLVNYDLSSPPEHAIIDTPIPNGAIFKVLVDETNYNYETYYQYDSTNPNWTNEKLDELPHDPQDYVFINWIFIGDIGQYYTKTQSDGRFARLAWDNIFTGANTFSKDSIGVINVNRVHADTNASSAIKFSNNGNILGYIGISSTAGFAPLWLDSGASNGKKLIRTPNISNNTVGSSTLPVYIDSDGIAQPIDGTSIYSIRDTKVDNNINWDNIISAGSYIVDCDNSLDNSIMSAPEGANNKGILFVMGPNYNGSSGKITQIYYPEYNSTYQSCICVRNRYGSNSSWTDWSYIYNQTDNDNRYVKLSGEQTITGTKSFSSGTIKIGNNNGSVSFQTIEGTNFIRRANNGTLVLIGTQGTGILLKPNGDNDTAKDINIKSDGTIEVKNGSVSVVTIDRSNSGTVTAGKFSGHLEGTADVATKLGTDTVGNVSTPIYLNQGTPTACNQMTDNKVEQQILSNVSDATSYPLLLTGNSGQNTSQTTTSNFSTGLSIRPYRGTLVLQGLGTPSGSTIRSGIELLPDSGSQSYGGIKLDNTRINSDGSNALRIVGLNSEDGTTSIGNESATLFIDPFNAKIHGGFTFNGATINSTSFNGATINSTSFNGATINSTSFNGIEITNNTDSTINLPKGTPVIQKNGINFIRRTDALILSANENSIILRPNGDTSGTGQATLNKDGMFTATRAKFASGDNFPLTIHRGTSDGESVIRFTNGTNETILGYVGINKDKQPIVLDNSGGNAKIIPLLESITVGGSGTPCYINNGVVTACDSISVPVSGTIDRATNDRNGDQIDTTYQKVYTAVKYNGASAVGDTYTPCYVQSDGQVAPVTVAHQNTGYLNWNSSPDTNGKRLVTISTLAHWNGIYGGSSSTSSNLQYCFGGEIVGTTNNQTITGEKTFNNSIGVTSNANIAYNSTNEAIEFSFV